MNCDALVLCLSVYPQDESLLWLYRSLDDQKECQQGHRADDNDPQQGEQSFGESIGTV